MLDRGKSDPLVFHPFYSVSKPKGINSKLEVGFRRGIGALLDQMQVIVDQVRVNFNGEFIDVEGKLGQVTAVDGQGL